ncbi:hypothetical protein A3C77_01370 [Candidatus Giovannonibacteria bacterium RIFCSPHIGHO2_02_FULL_45_13]|uniref:Cytochrome C biogenesis protein transmembrane domain-containing protein n=1 Tax=Candidatus Giovannonibacteria bacterium RIFCSPHIGHO2_01_FULL_45_23 TaxID=1798325 RepID=A0A1F5VFL3_9BACT|nr:MAG: hypothetical protein A2834_01160 [Candidatus Giovannonibacteria bacterium RIFCSPHIGHO2_01_FULL_45_23]OGF75149.1 MAG: hypothetical protein A3C77_01370 [Candidatus Giovannonibacteria bacterium RIFCSPHIGHO2_02_FULL_45_13]
MQDQEPKKILGGLIAAFSLIIIVGLVWFFSFSPASPIGAGWFLFSFAAGLSMIILPCTLPLAFVIVPLSMGKGVAKGLKIALAFSLGIAITLSLYGVLAAYFGEVAVGTLGAPLEVVKNWLYFIAGLFAYIFALGELGLVRFRMPTYSGAYPSFIQRQGDVFKALLLGLFLGNIGIGCPHPATPLILTRIAVSGDIFYGWLLFFVHAAGRVIPLILLAILGILGLNALSWLTSRREKIERATGWAMVFVAAFILVLGLFSHDWWVWSGTHSLLETITQEERFVGIISERFQSFVPHIHGFDELEGKTGLFGLPLWLGNWVLLALWIIPFFWYWLVKGGGLASPSQGGRLLFWFFVTLSLFLWLLFGYTIPHWFQEHKALGDVEALPVEIDIVPRTELGIGALVGFELKIQDRSGEPLNEVLEYSHERLIHVLIIHEDFKLFNHFHPEDFTVLTEDMFRTGVFPFALTFQKEGRYIVAVDFTHKGHEVAFTKTFDVGQRKPSALLKDFSKKGKFNGLDVVIEIDPANLVFNEKSHFKYSFSRGGVGAGIAPTPVADLEPYLGAPMHFAIVSADLSSFAHTHGTLSAEEEEHHGWRAVSEALAHEGEEEDSRKEKGEATKLPNKFGPDIFLNYTFPYPGIYTIFGEARHQGKVILTKFMVEVGADQDGAMPAPNEH